MDKFSYEDTLTSHIIEEMQIKTTVRHYFTLTRMAIIKNKNKETKK